MLPDQEQEVPAVFSDWYDSFGIEELLCMPLYRNLLNANITLNLNGPIGSRYAVQEKRLGALVIPQIDGFIFELLALESDTRTGKNFAYLKLYLRTALTKDSEIETLIVEIRLGEGASYSLSELVDGNLLSLYDLPPLILLQIKEIDTLRCKVKIGPIESIEI